MIEHRGEKWKDQVRRGDVSESDRGNSERLGMPKLAKFALLASFAVLAIHASGPAGAETLDARDAIRQGAQIHQAMALDAAKAGNNAEPAAYAAPRDLLSSDSAETIASKLAERKVQNEAREKQGLEPLRETGESPAGFRPRRSMPGS